eukprot:CAMPEP_0170498818 /NCGR_PEP_ID=MMETSP0208-20121228/29086_1 /TAXON_ID=197538 /ORGANISM="Strombidium inclinatum, Strain S3" /LENGTH=65 /DNA_ID=CAMNT_0010776111 /DNA_START=1821 /DNA_END=2018 /DNA_ORIENTATION=+
MLDFSQLKQGSYKKMVASFDLKKAIEEVVDVVSFKAAHFKVHITIVMEGFRINEQGRQDYTVTSD